MKMDYLLLIVSLYAIIATGGWLTWLMIRRFQSLLPRLAIVLAAALLTGCAWEMVDLARRYFHWGNGASHSYGFYSSGYVLMGFLRASLTALLALPAAMAVSSLMRGDRERRAGRGDGIS